MNELNIVKLDTHDYNLELAQMLEPIQLDTTIMVRPSDKIATKNILETVEWAKRHKQQLDLAKKVYEEACAIIKNYMGDAETLISPDGCRLATYKQQKDRTELDKDALKLNFADVYDICLITKKGNRPFELT